MKRKRKKLIVLIILILFACTCMPPFMNVHASSNTKLILETNNNLSYDPLISNKNLIYKIGDTIVGTVNILINNSSVDISRINNGKAEFDLPDNNATITIKTIPNEGYKIQPSYFLLPSTNGNFNNEEANININSGDVLTMDFSFEQNNGQGGGGNNDLPPLPMPPNYEVIASFSGSDSVSKDEFDRILVPDDWSNGTISFKAKACVLNNKIVSEQIDNTCEVGVAQDVNLRIADISNYDKINNTVTKNTNNLSINVNNNFMNYGLVSLILTDTLERENDEEPTILSYVDIYTKDLICIEANSTMGMNFAQGYENINQALVTKDNRDSLSIFYGNNQTTLNAIGYNVDKIIKVNDNTVVVDSEGNALINLPSLSKETVTSVKLTIKLKDNSTVDRVINICRTAILLGHTDHELKIGYVMNINYLYNDVTKPFDGYMQVILYSGNKVVKYLQVEINEEEYITHLKNGTPYTKLDNTTIYFPEGGSWCIIPFSDDAISIDLSKYDNVTSASVFLTNGKLDGNKNTLSPIEFGIGSGVNISW